MNKKYLKGFTLVELMVTISVIGILTAVISANFNDARQQANDKKRMTDLKSLQLSLELYKSQYGRYPAQGCGTAGSDWAGPGTASGIYKKCSPYIVGHTAGVNFIPDFVQTLPTDSKSTAGKGFYYMTNADGSSYKAMIYDTVESLKVTSYGDEFARCPKQTGACSAALPPDKTYAVYSKGAEGW